MSPRSLLASAGVVGATVLVAMLAGLAAGAVGGAGAGAGAVVASIAAAVVIAATFAWRPVEGLGAFVIAALLVDTIELWAGADLRYLDEGTIGLLLAVAVAVHRRRLAPLRFGAREAALAVFLAAALASTVVQGVPLNVWAPGLVLLGKGFAFFFVVWALRFDRDDLLRLATTMLGFGAAVVAIGLAEFVAPDLVRGRLALPASDQQRGDVTIVTSVFLHPALYGWLTAFLSLFLYARFAVDRRPWALGLALVLNLGTLLSGRRTPIIGVVAALGIGAARQVRASREAWRTWGAVAAALVLVAVLALPFLSSLVRSTLVDYVAPPELIAEIFEPDPDPTILRTMQPRIGLYLGSLAIARDELPLGVGIGRYGSHMSREVYSPVYAEYGMDGMYGIAEMWPIAVTDTFWPMILGEAGLLGLVAAAAFFGLLGRDLWRGAALPGSTLTRTFLLGALLIYVEALVRSLTSSVFVAPPIAYVVFGTIALALSVARTESERPAES